MRINPYITHTGSARAPDECAIQVDRDGGPNPLTLADRVLAKAESADVEVDQAVLQGPPLEQRFARWRCDLRAHAGTCQHMSTAHDTQHPEQRLAHSIKEHVSMCNHTSVCSMM